MDVVFSAEFLASVVGVIISLVFSYFPKLKDAYAGLSSEAKSGIMLGLLAFVAAGITALDYFNIVNAGIDFSGQWGARVAFVFLSAVIANQAAYKISPQTRSVKVAKDERDWVYVGDEK